MELASSDAMAVRFALPVLHSTLSFLGRLKPFFSFWQRKKRMGSKRKRATNGRPYVHHRNCDRIRRGGHCPHAGPMSTRKGQAASVTLLRREQLRSASAPTKSIVDSLTSIRRKSRARLWSMESPENRPKGSLVVSFFSSRCDTVLFFLRIEKEKNGVAKFPQLFSCCCFLLSMAALTAAFSVMSSS